MSLVVGLYLISAGLAALCVGCARHYLRNQLIDIPNERSSHQIPTPRGGGLGLVFAAFLGWSLYIGLTGQSSFVLPFLLLLPLIGVGLLDDFIDLSASIRYFVQLCVAGSIVFYLGAFPQPWLSSLGAIGDGLAISTTIIGITALINFYNFMDGLDGLLGGISLIQLSFFAVVFDQPFLWILVGALSGFLLWNWSPAKIFMGDSGSTFLGAVVSVSLLLSASSNLSGDPLSIWSCLTVLLPLTGDTVYTLCRRALRKENILKAHRSHIYQRLNQSGWSHSQVAILYICASSLAAMSWRILGSSGALLNCIAGGLCILSIELLLRNKKCLINDLPENQPSPALAKSGQ